MPAALLIVQVLVVALKLATLTFKVSAKVQTAAPGIKKVPVI